MYLSCTCPVFYATNWCAFGFAYVCFTLQETHPSTGSLFPGSSFLKNQIVSGEHDNSEETLTSLVRQHSEPMSKH